MKGFISTVGMVFVSYAGLTKVASISEEVENPDRNIPWGMFLSIITALTVYVTGVYLMTAVLSPEAFQKDLTPVATAGEVFLNWLPGDTGLMLVVIAAIAAFASTGNAGIMSSSRFPLAMARDSLIHPGFSKVGRFNTPTNSILITVGIMLFILLVFNFSEVAKLASAFKLLIFGLLNLSVIVMRESKIEEYDPGFSSPLYPWLQLAGMLTSIILIFEMGQVSILFTVGVVVFAVGWYYYYAYGKIDRQGAIYHVHARLGEFKDRGLESEMRTILQEKGLREEDPYEVVVSRAAVLDCDDDYQYDDIIRNVCSLLASKMPIEEDQLYEDFSHISDFGAIPIGRGTALYHTRTKEDVQPEMVLVRAPNGIKADIAADDSSDESDLHALIFLVSSEKHSSQHLRFLAHLAEMIDKDSFLERWIGAEDEVELREILHRDERFLRLTVTKDSSFEYMIGKQIREIDLPGESLITLLKRGENIEIPHGNTSIQEGDLLLVIGEVEDIEKLNRLAKEE
jgi:mannitol/fructose-specific phosphotransferase system IIA component (Ntr-type)